MRISRIPVLVFLFTTLALCSAGHAQLVFAQNRVVHTAEPGEEKFRAEFPFVNESNETVTIAQIRSTCGCTVPELGKKVYAPGESGTVTAVFTYGQRTGRQQKTITVTTSAGTQHLHLEVLIPQKWTVEPRIQTWRLNGAPETKTVIVQFDALKPQDVRLASYPEEGFSAETDWNAGERTFTIRFTPQDLTAGGVLRAHVTATTEEGTADIPIYLRVY